MDLKNLGNAAKPEKKMALLKGAEVGSKMQLEFDRDQGLAETYLAEANVRDLFKLYERRCQQLQDFGGTLATMAELYAGKSERNGFGQTADAVEAMERVALSAIELAKAFVQKTSK